METSSAPSAPWFLSFWIAESTAFLYESAATPLGKIFPLQQQVLIGSEINQNPLQIDREKNRFKKISRIRHIALKPSKWDEIENTKILGEIEKTPSIVDIVASIAVIREASTETGFVSEFPNRVGFFPPDSDNPTRPELHRNAAEILHTDSSTDTIRRLQNHHVVYSILHQHLRRRQAFRSKKIPRMKKNPQKKNYTHDYETQSQSKGGGIMKFDSPETPAPMTTTEGRDAESINNREITERGRNFWSIGIAVARDEEIAGVGLYSFFWTHPLGWRFPNLYSIREREKEDFQFSASFSLFSH